MIGGPAEDSQHSHAQGCDPGHPVGRARPGRRSRVQGNQRGAVFFRRLVRRVELVDQRSGIDPHGAGDGADMAADVEVTAAGGVVVLLDAPDDGGPDPGPAADLTDAETQPATRVSQHLADAHAPPPLPQSRPRRLAYGVYFAIPVMARIVARLPPAAARGHAAGGRGFRQAKAQQLCDTTSPRVAPEPRGQRSRPSGVGSPEDQPAVATRPAVLRQATAPAGEPGKGVLLRAN